MVKIKFKSNFTEAQILSMPQLLKKTKKKCVSFECEAETKTKQTGWRRRSAPHSAENQCQAPNGVLGLILGAEAGGETHSLYILKRIEATLPHVWAAFYAEFFQSTSKISSQDS